MGQSQGWGGWGGAVPRGAGVISFNTVKTHSKSIYRKLGVGQRHDAVARARALDLI